MKKTGVGLYGRNGHQINGELASISSAYHAGTFDALSDMLVSKDVRLASICSPNRGEQAKDVLAALEAGKHVLAEKPCALNERDLDAILETAKKKNLIFCEMDASYFTQPFHHAMEIMRTNPIGEVIQAYCQKSYPYTERRQQDETVDGGLVLQCALYGFRWIQNIAGREATGIRAIETRSGNPKGGGLVMAASIQMRLDNGGVASILANYLNQPSTGVWGYEEAKFFGTSGVLHVDAIHNVIYLYSGQEAIVYDSFPTVEGQLSRVVASICEGKPLYMDPYRMTMPTRYAIRAKAASAQLT